MNDTIYPGSDVDRYHIIQKLGRGGTCEVYKAQDSESGAVLALKALLNNQSLLRFKREFRSMSRLSHKNIAKVFDYGEYAGRAYFTMEYIEGGDLKSRLQHSEKHSELDARTVPTEDREFESMARLFLQICEPLQYIHGLKIVHRDLKPGNIMLTPDGIVKLMDFGLVKEADIINESLTKTGTFVGTVAYMSPEQGLGRNLDHRSDLYSMGVILYEALTGRLPFSGKSVLEVFMKHIQESPIPASQINPTIPKILESLCILLLSKRPQERPASAAEVSIRLEEYLKPQIADMFDTLSIKEDSLEAITLAGAVQIPGLFVPGLIGREDAFQIVDIELGEVNKGCPRILVIEGETGMGKTALIQEIASRSRLENMMLLRGASSEVEHYPYSAFMQPLEQLAEKLIDKDIDYQKSILSNRGPVLASICPRFGEIAWVNQQPVPQHLEAYQEKLRAFDAIKILMENTARDRPLVIAIDDLQWSDDLSLEFIGYFIRSIHLEEKQERLPLMILTSFRSEDAKTGHPVRRLQQSISRDPLFRQIILTALTKERTQELIEALLGAPIKDEDLLNQVYLESGGNPFFIHEILKELIDDQMLIKQAEGWLFNADETREMTVPSTLQSVSSVIIPIPARIREIIYHRIEKLSEPIRDILVKAGIIGIRFEFDLLSSLVDVEEDDLLDYLGEAIREEIIDEVAGSGGEVYRFRHQMVRNVLYSSLPTRKRIRLHSRLADVLSVYYASNIKGKYDLIAYHLDAGNRLAEAADYYLKAAHRMQLLGLPQFARNYSDRVIEIAPRSEGTPEKKDEFLKEAYIVRGISFETTGHFDEALKDFSQIKRMGDERNDPLIQAKGLYHIGSVYMDRGMLTDSMDAFERALDTLPDTPKNVSQRALIENNIALNLMNLGKYPKSLEMLTRIKTIMHDTGNQSGLAMCCSNLGMVYYYLGDYNNSFELFELSVRIYRELNEQYRVIKVLNNLAGVFLSRGDTDNVLKCNMESLEIARKIGDVYSVAAVQGNSGLIYQERGEYSKAAVSFRESLSISKRLGDRLGVSIVLINYGNLLVEMGSIDAALESIHKVVEMAEDMGDRWIRAYALHQMGEYYFIKKMNTESIASFDLAMIEIQSIGLRALEIQCRANTGLLKALMDKADTALSELEKLLPEAAALNDSDAMLKCLYSASSAALSANAIRKCIRYGADGLKRSRNRRHVAYEWRFYRLLGQAQTKRDKLQFGHRCLIQAVNILVKINKSIEPGYRRQFFLHPEVRDVFESIRSIAATFNRDSEIALYDKILNLDGI